MDLEFSAAVNHARPVIFKYGYSSKLVAWLKQNHRLHDVVIVNGIWQYNSFAVWRALRHSETPYCVYTHGMLDPWFRHHYPLKHLKKWLYWPWADYRVLRDAAAVLFTCEEERVQARKSFWLYQCRERVVNYGTAKPAGSPVEQKETFLSQFSHLRGKRIVLFLGRIHEKKGCDLLLHAFQKLLNEHPEKTNLHLVMAGPADSEFALRLKRDVTDLGMEARVSWLGMVSGDLKWGAYHAAHAFILPSHQENFGISVAESMACGIPVLISDKVNIWREIEQDGAGIIAPDNFEGTLELLRRWVGMDEAEWSAMGDRASACFRKRFEINPAARSMVATLKNVIEEFKARRSVGKL